MSPKDPTLKKNNGKKQNSFFPSDTKIFHPKTQNLPEFEKISIILDKRQFLPYDHYFYDFVT